MSGLGVRVVRKLVCDLCGSEKDVERWHLEKDKRKRFTDLCDRHGKPLAEIFEAAPERRGDQGKREVLTEAQVKKKVRAFREAKKRA